MKNKNKKLLSCCHRSLFQITQSKSVRNPAVLFYCKKCSLISVYLIIYLHTQLGRQLRESYINTLTGCVLSKVRNKCNDVFVTSNLCMTFVHPYFTRKKHLELTQFSHFSRLLFIFHFFVYRRYLVSQSELINRKERVDSSIYSSTFCHRQNYQTQNCQQKFHQIKTFICLCPSKNINCRNFPFLFEIFNIKEIN